MTQSIMDLFAEWQALDERNAVEVLSDDDNDARADYMAEISDRMKAAGPKTAGELAAFLYARTIGCEAPCNKEDASYLLDVIETESQSPRLKAIPDPNIAILSIRDMKVIFEALGMIDNICTAISCQPRCVAATSGGFILGMTPAGDFMEAIEGWACAIRERIREEAICREPSRDRFDREYQMHMALHGSETPEEAIRLATAFIRSDIKDFTAEGRA